MITQRIKRPLAGLAVASFFAVMTYRAATTIAAGGTKPAFHGRGALFSELAWAVARELGVWGTVTAGALLIGVSLVFLGRALRLPAGPYVSPRAPVVLAPRPDVIDAFERVRSHQRWYSVAQFGVMIALVFLIGDIARSSEVPPIETAAFVASLAALGGVTVAKLRAWSCPACGKNPGLRSARMCASCGAPLYAGLVDERAANLIR